MEKFRAFGQRRTPLAGKRHVAGQEDGKLLLRSLCELNQRGRWAFEDCLTGDVVYVDEKRLPDLRLVKRAPRGERMAV